MLTNHLRIAFRNLLKNKLYSFLNITGLSVGLAGGILVLLWVSHEWSFNRFHPNLENIHVILQNQTQGGETYTFQAMPGPLAAGLRTEFPEVEWAARTSWNSKFLLSVGEKKTYERGFHAEPDFFNIFSFPTLSGNPVAAMRESGSIVISQRTAEKFFGKEDPIGKTIRVENEQDFKVAAVIANVPTNSTLRFDVVMPFSIVEKRNLAEINSNWGNNSWPNWVSLHPKTDLAALNAKLENYIQSKNPEAAAHAMAYPLSEFHLRGKFKEGKPDGGRVQIMTLLGIVGLFVLLIACVNFMNLATARSAGRAREVGVRKVVGAPRSLIVGQFLTEALVMTFLALFLSVCWVKLLLPGFNKMAEKELSLGWQDWQIWSSILTLGLLTGLVAGSYPALFLSKFRPALALKGNVSSNKNAGTMLRKGLVTFQFVISIFLIITTMVIHRQLDHIDRRPLGFDAENLISIPVRGDMASKFGILKQEMLQIPGVRAVSAGSHNMVSFGSNTSGIGWPGKTEEQDFLISITEVGYDFVKTAGLEMADGRDFSPEFGADTLACLLNETAVRRMGLKEPVVGTVLQSDTNYTVIGVVKDFVFNNPENTIEPMAIFLSRQGFNHFFVQFDNDGQWKNHLAKIESTSKSVFPEYPFEFRFVKDDYQKNFEGIRSTGKMANAFALLAVFISCLGLFGLSAFFAEKRTKEIGIRKVLGASVAGLWLFLSKDFFKPVLLAFALTIPPAIWAMEKLLSNFDYRVELSWSIFAVAGVVALGIAIFTVSFQSVKAALANPVKSLRSE